MHFPILAPVVLLAAWTMVIWTWMYATRIPAIQRAKMRLDPEAPRGEQMASLPPRVRWKADNYNHLMEQPTIFYPAVLIIALTGASALDIRLAWGYVAIRVIHSLWQGTVNRIPVRASLFFLSSIVLIVLAVRALLATLSAAPAIVA